MISPHWNRNTYSHTSSSLIAFSYGHWIPPQGEVQSDRSSYDNIIVRTVKGQTAARLVLRGLCWENPQMASALLQGQHSAKCLWEGDKCQWGPLSLLSPFSPQLVAPHCSAVSRLKLLAAGYVFLGCSCSEMLAAAESTLYMLPSALEGHITVIGED